MKIIKNVLIILLIAFVLIQFYPPEKNLSDSVPETDIIVMTDPPETVKTILKTSCYDCHSNTTNYPWYNAVVPVSYWLADHIKHGKEHLNFSEWGTYNTKKKAHKLEELTEEVKKREMPLNSYLWVHGDARLSDEQIKALTGWADALRLSYRSAATPQQERP
ncbi:MAG: heme-binding domain-containing protein, partial [Sinomicrobium sp.]|nr:heme-binding domain-containing protein [Sinomicrobium sp.]